MDDIIKKIKSQIEAFEPASEFEKIGHVSAVGDGIATIDGLSDALMSEMVVFDTGEGKPLEDVLKEGDGVLGMILNLEEDAAKAVILGQSESIREGMTVKSTGKILSIPVGENLIGRVIDPLGRPLDGGVPIHSEVSNPIERRAYGVIERKSVNAPLHTGIKAIDAMIPIGRGQRELIIGDRQTGKTTIALDTILNQINEDPKNRPICIYVAIGQKDSKVARFVHELKERGAMEYSIIVSAGASSPAALQFLAPYSGAAIGEYFMDKGKDALAIYDDLSKHATAYRQMSLLLRRPPGREAYPGDIFYLHSRLLERAAKLSDAMGGGSLTALPIIETQEGDVSAYIPTNVISITDGQIYLESDLFNKGIKPAINVGLSVSRVGSSAQTKAMKKVAGKLRLELAQFRELEAFVQFAQDLDVDTKKRIERGRRTIEILKQGKRLPMKFEAQVVLLYATINGFFDSVPTGQVQSAGGAFVEYVESQKPELLKSIREYRDLAEETEEGIKKIFNDFRNVRVDLFKN